MLDEGDADGEQPDGKRDRPSLQRALGQAPEEKDAGDAAQEGKEPDRKLVPAEC
jgi:hypothetical protein